MNGWFEREIDAEDERAVTAFMARLAATPMPVTHHVPDALSLWWKAQLLRRWDAHRRVQAPLDVMEPIEIAAGLAAAAALFVWSLPSLLKLLA